MNNLDFTIDIHPESLKRLGEMEIRSARAFLKLSGWFNPIEVELLIEKAGCKAGAWTPFKVGKYRNAFLLC